MTEMKMGMMVKEEELGNLTTGVFYFSIPLMILLAPASTTHVTSVPTELACESAYSSVDDR